MSTKFRHISDNHEEGLNRLTQPKIKTVFEETYSIETIKQFAHKKDLYFQIEKSSLVENTIIDFLVFKQKLINFTLFIEATQTNPVMIEKKHIDSIWSDELSALAIQKKDLFLFKNYIKNLLNNTKSVVSDNKTKAIFMRENSKIIINEVLSEPRSGEKIKEISNIVTDISESIISDSDMLFNMLSLSSYDYYTYNHCLNVAVLCIGMGILHGMRKRDLRHFGIGAMLHDIGKTLIAPEILNKPTRLTEIEFRTMQRHVLDGVALMKENPAFPKESLDPLLYHHEKISGKGYPNMLKGSEIPLTGKIIGIADCYDALTTSRPYKPAMTPFQALHVISQEREDYDPVLLTCFVKMLGKIKQKR
ncbi:MAG: HD domain-containing phosphohydrolase [Thermodesulfovibrionales bacterium]